MEGKIIFSNEESSLPRKREGGFTFEVQQFFQENLRWSFKVQALSRSVIIGSNQRQQALFWQCSQVRFSRKPSAHSSDGIFNAAFLPRRVGIAEKGAHRQFMQSLVVSELSAVIEGDGSA